jgi:4'-phosphopantetheinyl transferase
MKPTEFMSDTRAALALDGSGVHLWLTFVQDAADPALHQRYRQLMTAEEQARADRFYFERDRQRYLVTRALVRTVLSRYAPVAPTDWRFEPNEHGRPLIVNDDAAARSLSFNLTHTDDLIALAVTRGREVGIDTENIERGAPLDVADRYFAPSEVRDLRALRATQQPLRFFELWTLKESYIKARGMGLAIPLRHFAFDLRDERRVSLAIAPELQDPTERWALRQLWPSERHPLALCVEHLNGRPFDLLARRIVPLATESVIELPVARHNG